MRWETRRKVSDKIWLVFQVHQSIETPESKEPPEAMSNDAMHVAREAKKELDDRFRGSDEAEELSALLNSPHIQVQLQQFTL